MMAIFNETSIPGIFQNQVISLGDKPCVAFWQNGVFIDVTWNEMNLKIRQLASYLISIGIKSGDKVGLFSENRYEWWIADQAILSIGAVDVPIYATNTAEETQYILENSKSIACITSNQDLLDKTLKALSKVRKIKRIIVIEDVECDNKKVITLKDACDAGEKKPKDKEIDKRIKAIKSDDLATLIYTSGTTGNPKGVMLTQNNFVSNVNNTLEAVIDLVRPDDSFLSFLPLSHSLERTAGYYLPMSVGAKVSFARDFSTLLEDLMTVQPSIIISVPRIYEKIRSTILGKVAGASFIKKMIFGFAISSAKKNLPYVCKEIEPKGLTGLRIKLADKLVFSKLKEALGMNRLRYAISGGGPLSIADAEFFIGMGVEILEGFGLTETTPITHYNLPGDINPGTVGTPIPQTEVKISDEGEILIKGPQVMKGYYNNKKGTAEVFTKDGYFKTGDIGIIDDENHLTITGRIKDIIVTAGGKNISPQNIENSIKASQYIEQIGIIGDKRKYLSALIVPAFEEVKNWAQRNNIAFSSNDDLIGNVGVMDLITEEVEKNTEHFSRVEKVKRFKLLDAEWTQDSGELTPKQSVKRRVVEDKYKSLIDEMYL